MTIDRKFSSGDELQVHTVGMLSKERMNKGVWFYSSIEQEQPNIIKKIFKIEGVNAVLLYNKYLQISKIKSFSWESITPKIEEIIQNIKGP